jgi:tetratricopeptide (TPR) repeat protein
LNIINIRQLLQESDPQVFISRKLWSSWTEELSKSPLSSRTVYEVAIGLGLDWPVTKKSYKIARYIRYSLDAIASGFALNWHDARTVILCIAACALELQDNNQRSAYSGLAQRIDQTKSSDELQEFHPTAPTLTEDSTTAKEWVERGIALKENGNIQAAINAFNNAIDIDRYHATAFFYRGLTYNELEQYEAAKKDFSITIELEPDHAPARYYLLAVCEKMEIPVDTKSPNAETRMAQYSEDSESLLRKAFFLYDTGNYQAALLVFDEIIEINPKCAPAYFGKGNALSYQGQYEKAIWNYDRVILLNPHFSEAYRERAFSYWNLGNLNSAFDDLENACKMNPEDKVALQAKEYLLNELDTDEAVDDFLEEQDSDERAEDLRDEQDSNEELDTDEAVDDFLEEQDSDEAAEDTDKQVPTETINRQEMTESRFFMDEIPIMSEVKTEAIRDSYQNPEFYERFEVHDSEDIPFVIDSESSTLLTLDSENIYQNNKDIGCESLQKNQETGDDNRDTDYFIDLGRQKYESKDYIDSIKYFLKAAEVNPKLDFLYKKIGQAYYFLGDYENAIEHLDQAVRLLPTHSETYYYRGLCYQEIKEYQNAIDDFTKAIDLDFDDKEEDAFFHLGLTYSMINEYDKAKDSFDEVIRLNPHYPGINDALKQVLLIDSLHYTTTHRESKVLALVADKAFKELFYGCFSTAGFEILFVQSQIEALNALSGELFDLILITNFHLPELGIYILSTIRRNHPQLGIIFVSNCGGIRERILRAGADDFVAVPINVYDLIASAKKIVARNSIKSIRR